MIRLDWFECLLAVALFALVSTTVSGWLTRVTQGHALWPDHRLVTVQQDRTRIQSTNSVALPGCEDLTGGVTAMSWKRRIFCLHIPFLETDRVRRDQPGSRPVVLTRRTGNSVLIEQVCPRAAALGLQPGTTLGQAQARVPELVSEEYSREQTEADLQRMARWLQRFSPLVQVCQPRTLLLDITGCGPLFAGERNLCQQLLGALTRRGLRVVGAVADTVGTAWALAVAGQDTLTIVPPEQNSAYLAPLPPSSLRLAAGVVTQLDALGVRTIRDLFLLPRASVSARFGSETVLRMQQALGQVIEPVRDDVDLAAVQARIAFEEPVQDCAVLESMANHLLHDVLAELHQREQSLLRLALVLTCAHADPLWLEIRLARPARSHEYVAPLLGQRLQQVDLSQLQRNDQTDAEGCALPDGVLGMRLQALQASPWKAQQARMFDASDLMEEEAVAVLIDQVVNRLGSGVISRPVLLDDHQPERSYRYQPAEVEGVMSEPEVMPGGRPSQILPEPCPIEVLGKPPRCCSIEGHTLAIATVTGPQRVETAWWRGPDVRRDYYRIESEQGEQYWLFQSLPDGNWYLHGTFL